MRLKVLPDLWISVSVPSTSPQSQGGNISSRKTVQSMYIIQYTLQLSEISEHFCKSLCASSFKATEATLRLALSSTIKESVSRDFWPQFFYHDSNPSGPLINRVKYFRILLRFRRDIWSQSSKNSTPRCAWHHEAKF